MWVRFNADQWGCAVAMREALQQWAAMDPPRAYVDDEEGAVRVPLLLRTGVEKDAVVLDAVRQLRELGAMMVAGRVPVLNGCLRLSEWPALVIAAAGAGTVRGWATLMICAQRRSP